MKGITGWIVIVLVGVAGMLEPVQVEAAEGVGPYYAIPSWDQTLPAATRFVVLTNFASAAVLDRETGLVWERNPPEGRFVSFFWVGALGRCTNLNIGGRKGWRLPTIEELSSLVDPSVASPGPVVAPGSPFVVDASVKFWSATTAIKPPFSGIPDASEALYVDFATGLVGATNKTSLPLLSSWCVRGGSGGSPR